MKFDYLFLAMLFASACACPSLKERYQREDFLQSCANASSPSCTDYLKSIVEDLASCHTSVSVVRLTANYDDFMSGLIYGLQKDPRSKSQCMASSDPLSKATETLRKRVEDFLSEIKVLSLFDILDDFNEFMNQLVSLYELCGFQLLIKRISEVPTRDGLAYIVLRLGSHFDTIIDGIDFGTQELVKGCLLYTSPSPRDS